MKSREKLEEFLKEIDFLSSYSGENLRRFVGGKNYLRKITEENGDFDTYFCEVDELPVRVEDELPSHLIIFTLLPSILNLPSTKSFTASG